MKKPRNPNSLKNLEKGKHFSKEHQPSPEAKSMGKRKRTLTKELMELALSDKGESMDYIRSILSDVMGLTTEELKKYTIREIMDLRQIEKAIKHSDTNAYKLLVEISDGIKQNIENSGEITIRIIRTEPEPKKNPDKHE